MNIMKKIILTVLFVAVSLCGFSQKGKVNSALSAIQSGDLSKAKADVEAAIANEKSASWGNTYVALGELYQAQYAAGESSSSDLLEQAYDAYKKALSLDVKDAAQKKMKSLSSLSTLVYNYGMRGVERYGEGDYAAAMADFGRQVELLESAAFSGVMDTSVYYNAGLAALNNKSFNEAVNYFQKCIDLNFGGIDPHVQLAECYSGLGQSAKAEEYLLDLPSKFPNEDVTLRLANMYINSKNNPKAIEYLDKAIQQDPSNYLLYNALGSIYLTEEKFNEAISNLEKARQLNSENFNTNYNLGIAFINYGGYFSNVANELDDIAAYNKAVEDANAQYFKAIPCLEKALTFEEDNIDVMNFLKELYFRLRQEDASLVAKYNEINAKINSR